MDTTTTDVADQVPEPGAPAPASRVDHALGRIAPVVVVAALVAIIALAFAGCSEPESELPVYWEAPEFALVHQQGDTLRTAGLRGTPWVASFVFTNCTGVCPLITQKMARLRDSLQADGLLGGEVRLVSFSVDPARDTPAVLREYAERFGASPPEEWAFLTGTPPEAVRTMIQKGFKLTANLAPEHEHGEENYQVMHSPRLVLVDAAGRVRGLYDTTEPDALDRLGVDLRALLE